MHAHQRVYSMLLASYSYRIISLWTLTCIISTCAVECSAYCTHTGKYCHSLQKMIYPGNRCFLQADNMLRLDEQNFPHQNVDNSESPEIM